MPHSGDLLSVILADHKEIYILVDTIKYKHRPQKCIKNEVNNDKKNLLHYVDELKQLNIYESLDTNLQTDSNQNYDTCEKLLLYAKHLTTNTINCCKHKQKKIEMDYYSGILKLINTQDKLYKALVQTYCTHSTVYKNLKTNFKTYTNILMKTVREAKTGYYNRAFLQYKDNIFLNLVHH